MMNEVDISNLEADGYFFRIRIYPIGNIILVYLSITLKLRSCNIHLLSSLILLQLQSQQTGWWPIDHVCWGF